MQPPRPVQLDWLTPARFGRFLLVVASLVVGISLTVFPPVYVVLAVTGIVGLVLLFYFPFLGALAYLTFEYARVSAMFPVLVPLQAGKLLVTAVFAAWLLNGLVSGRLKFVSEKINWVMLGWVVVGFLAIAGAARTDLATGGAVDLAKWAAIYILFANLINSPVKWHWFVWAFVLLNLKLSQFQLRSYAYEIANATDANWVVIQGVGAGSTSFLGNATDFGAAMCVVLPFAVYLGRCARPKWLRILGFAAAGFFVMSIIRTGSRGAAVAMFAMALVYWLKSRNKVPVAFAVVGLVIAVWIIAPPAWQDRFVSAANYEEDATASSRIDFWKAGIQMFLTHPLSGVGMMNFPHNYLAGGGEKAIAPHSIFVQAASELGLPGITILFALLYLILKRNRETRFLARGGGTVGRDLHAFADAMDLSLVGFVVSGAFLTILYYPHIFVILGMAVSLNQIAKAHAIQAVATPALSASGKVQ
jgi:O-antigen ligase